MQVFDQHHRRPIGRERVEERDPRPAKALARGEWMQVDRCLQPERQPQNRVSPKAAPHDLLRVVLGQAEMLADDIADWHVRDPSAVGEAAACAEDRFGRPRAEPLPKLPEQCRLPDPGVAYDGHEVRLTLFDDAKVRLLESLELFVTADEGALQSADTLRPHRRQRADETSTGDAVRFSFGRNRRRLGELERARHGRGRALADQNLTRPSALLETRCNVDRVARDEGTSDAGLSRDDLTGVHADT